MARFITTTKTSKPFLIPVPINIDLVCAIEKSIGINNNDVWAIHFHFSGQKPFSWYYEKEEDRDAEFESILRSFPNTY